MTETPNQCFLYQPQSNPLTSNHSYPVYQPLSSLHNAASLPTNTAVTPSNVQQSLVTMGHHSMNQAISHQINHQISHQISHHHHHHLANAMSSYPLLPAYPNELLFHSQPTLTHTVPVSGIPTTASGYSLTSSMGLDSKPHHPSQLPKPLPGCSPVYGTNVIGESLEDNFGGYSKTVVIQFECTFVWFERKSINGSFQTTKFKG